ncbi:uncharacterized protein Z518_04113 [Rhinocladiella mackenziei CBS 650.93]|uniref:Rhinocladiella mackenziei CBS 650.93 unplaced genomic scaffold supercont1.3, whole genome shotgun sequence n=1 Tax=Rhinocladiella mackenziei CBS 650.93 TaxID=1442369 RepID=A0A0D2IKB0_9EURO|nr:uncharacterized protein Z518_04113 [Rhinocladiella mackenziei CBS 650.93]KIX06139.1 hypothetical protein Z518_04113 [Rhinocladiella mackenziei CBS 650.93]
MEDGIVGDLPDEDLDPADIPPLPIFSKESYGLAKASADGDLPLLRSLFERHERSHDCDEREALGIAVRTTAKLCKLAGHALPMLTGRTATADNTAPESSDPLPVAARL